MGCRIFEGKEAGSSTTTLSELMFDSVTGWAFGPIMEHGQGEVFIAWMAKQDERDPRIMTSRNVEDYWTRFVHLARQCDCGQWFATGHKHCEVCRDLDLESRSYPGGFQMDPRD